VIDMKEKANLVLMEKPIGVMGRPNATMEEQNEALEYDAILLKVCKKYKVKLYIAVDSKDKTRWFDTLYLNIGDMLAKDFIKFYNEFTSENDYGQPDTMRVEKDGLIYMWWD